MKDIGIAVNIISNSWDDFIYDIEQMRVEIKNSIDINCSYYLCKSVVLRAMITKWSCQRKQKMVSR